jgi:hypothetical protein
MCEFWGLMLPPEVAADHPWPDFAREWRAWFLDLRRTSRTLVRTLAGPMSL